MTDIKSRWTSMADQATWRARGASFVAKLKATKLVWFPPRGAGDMSQRAAASANKTTRRATKKTARTTKKASGTAKKAAKKSASKPAKKPA